MVDIFAGWKQQWSVALFVWGAFFFINILAAHAQTIMAMKLDNIPGDSTVTGLQGWVTVNGLNEGVSKSGSALITAVDRIEVLKGLDISSPYLRHRAVTSQKINTAEIVMRNSNTNINTFKIVLTDVKVESVSTHFQEVGGHFEEVLLKFKSVSWTYTPLSVDGKPGSPITLSYTFPDSLSADEPQQFVFPLRRKK